MATAGQEAAQLTFIAAAGDSETSPIKGRCCSTDKLHMSAGQGKSELATLNQLHSASECRYSMGSACGVRLS